MYIMTNLHNFKDNLIKSVKDEQKQFYIDVLNEIHEYNISYNHIEYNSLKETIANKFKVNENDITKRAILIRQIDKVLFDLYKLMNDTPNLKQFVKKTKAPT